MAKSKVCIIGLGYIGLPTAAVLASHGYQVHGVDVHANVVDGVNCGKPLIDEPGLTTLVAECVSLGALTAGLTPCEADVFMLTVPTPFKDGHVPDLSYVDAALDAVAPYLQPDNLLILESTSPVGTTAGLAMRLQTLRPDLVIGEASQPRLFTDKRIHLAYCAERVFPGQILKELVGNDRIVGGLDTMASDRACEFYRSFATGTVHSTDAGTAEMCKLTENSFRDVNIAFANELSRICGNLGVNVWKVIELANSHPRVNVLRPGPGVGGHCIAVDPWFIVHSSPDQARIIRTAREINDEQPKHVVAQVRRCCEHLKEPTIACLGLTFKADVEDVRESPAVTVVEELLAAALENSWWRIRN